MKQKFIEIFGWYGTVAIIGAYALNSYSIIESDNAIYQLMNLTGAFGIIAVSYHKKVYQSVALNIIWSIIALSALFNLII